MKALLESKSHIDANGMHINNSGSDCGYCKQKQSAF